MKHLFSGRHFTRYALVGVALSLAVLSARAQGPSTIKWMNVGSLHSWFSSSGCEIEEGRPGSDQQDGLQWPGIFLYQDTEAAKGLWIGTTNFNDGTQTYPFKVVHMGPRVRGVGEFFPIRFQMISRFAPPNVSVDGNATSSGKAVENDAVDPNLPCDRMIINTVNTAIGLTMTRKIYAFSQGYHDNYFIYEYVLTNTGNADDDADIEYPGKTLTGVYMYLQYRYSCTKEARYVIGNSSGWGINTMNDTRGDGASPAGTFFPGNQDNDVRAQYAWHGRHPGFLLYDNIGASVWSPPQSTFEPFSDRQDTSGRLCAPQFVGVATVYADSSAGINVNAFTQPSTTSYESSDDQLNFNNDQFSIGKMTSEYQWMSKGHVSPRHADKVGPTGDPSQGYNTSFSSGGQSCANGYGPYTLAPGDSIRIVMAEAVAGLSREKAISVGTRFKNGTKYTPPLPGGITAAAKDDSVYTGRDSLFQTFRRAIANFQSGFAIPQPPFPPKDMTVTSKGDRITVSWDTYPGGSAVAGWRVYRAVGDYWRPYELAHAGDLPADTRSFDDTQVSRGAANFYYVVAVGSPSDNNGAGNTPAGVALTSSRYYAQSYDPAFLKRPPGDSPDLPAGSWIRNFRIVPNPYYINSAEGLLRFKDEGDKIAFFNIPSDCTIRIFTELGELVKEIRHTDPSGDEYWNSITSSGQVVVSGLYIVVVDNNRTGERAIQKLVVIR